jgi:hypothetical protein
MAWIDARSAAELLGVERWELAAMRRDGRIEPGAVLALNSRVVAYRLDAIQALAQEGIDLAEKDLIEKKDRLRAFRGRELAIG